MGAPAVVQGGARRAGASLARFLLQGWPAHRLPKENPMLATLRMSTLLGTALLCMSPFAAAGRSGYNPGRTVTRHCTPSLRLGGGIGLRPGKARVSIGFGVHSGRAARRARV